MHRGAGVSWPSARERVLARELDGRGAAALLVLGHAAEDPHLAPFVGPVHMGRSFVLFLRHPPEDRAAPRGHLGYLTAMERDEAAATGLSLIQPAELDLDALARERPEPGSFWGAMLLRAFEHVGLEPGTPLAEAAESSEPVRVAVAGHLGAGTVVGLTRVLDDAGFRLIDGGEIVRLLTKIKTPRDLDAIRAAARGTVAAFREIATMLAAAEPAADGALHLADAPLTVGRLRAAAGAVCHRHGLEQPHGNIVAPAEEGAVPHSAGTDGRVLKVGQSLVVDLYPKGELYADCTRTFCVGPPSEPLAQAHEATLGALEMAHREARPGVRGWDLQEKTCAHFEALGYETPISHPGTERGYVHGLGHGVGYELHETPSFRKESGAEGLLEAGDVITLEPGLYDVEAGYGVRLEDLVVLGEDGVAENLTPLPYDLDPRAWNR